MNALHFIVHQDYRDNLVPLSIFFSIVLQIEGIRSLHIISVFLNDAVTKNKVHPYIFSQFSMLNMCGCAGIVIYLFSLKAVRLQVKVLFAGTLLRANLPTQLCTG